MTRRPAQPELHGLFPAASPASERRWHCVLWAFTIAAGAFCCAASFGVFEHGY